MSEQHHNIKKIPFVFISSFNFSFFIASLFILVSLNFFSPSVSAALSVFHVLSCINTLC